MKVEDIRLQVRRQREFYTQAVDWGILNVALILLWVLFDTGSAFWPKYVILLSLIGLAIKGYLANAFPFFADHVQTIHNKFHFMSEEWEQDKVDELTGKKQASKSRPSAKKTPQKKVVGRTKKSS